MEVVVCLVILSLVGLNVWQHIYWNKINQTLIDKLMSRNYQEFQQVFNSNKNTERPKKVPDLPEDLRALQGFNF